MKKLLHPIVSALVSISAFADPAPAVQEGENQTEAMPVLANLSQQGGLSFGGADFHVAAFGPGWSGMPVKTDWATDATGPRRFEVRGAATYFTGTSEWTPQPDGTLRGHVEMECVAPVEMQCIAVAFNIPSPPPFGLGDASAAAFDLPLSDGRTARLTLPKPVRYHSQDSRPWGGQWTVRLAGDGGHLGHGGTRTFAPGERLAWDMVLSAPDGFALTAATPLLITENADWVRLDYRKDIEPGSALDLSGQGLQDAPAGKHGWLKAVGGHFEFEGLPGVEQRFYGVNLCFTANYPDHDLADRLVDRFVRCGYNTIRVHHHDGAWAAAYKGRRKKEEGTSAEGTGGSGAESPSFADDIDKLDYLLARCFERGLYVTTDLYVSRPVAWRDIGIDRDGDMDKQLYKAYVGIHDGAFADWCEYARAFLEHVNPYTGRAYKDEPGMPLISLINEGKLAMGWGAASKERDPVIREAWREFGGEGEVPNVEELNKNSPFSKFNDWVNRRIFERGSAFVRSLGCRALLTNDNNGRHHGEGEGTTPLYDYVDSHFYVDHPQFLEQAWRLPSKCGNTNPVKAENPAIFHRGWSSPEFSKPCTITEWNFSGPGRYRGMGGILTGAYAAEQAWDGLWRFAYSHQNGNLLDGQGNPGYFDCVTDPLIAASDRASVCLYLRGDAAQENGQSQDAALRLDTERGSMTLVSERTCGGFAESGRIDAGPLSFEIVPEPGKGDSPDLADTPDTRNTGNTGKIGNTAVPATLWASSLDGKPLASSSRILLTHLTDVQGNGAKYADDRRQVLLKWGRRCLIEAGAADVELRLDGEAGAASPTVWSLDTAGHRIGEVPAEMRDGVLRFRVSTNGSAGGRIYYEIVRD